MATHAMAPAATRTALRRLEGTFRASDKLWLSYPTGAFARTNALPEDSLVSIESSQISARSRDARNSAQRAESVVI